MTKRPLSTPIFKSEPSASRIIFGVSRSDRIFRFFPSLCDQFIRKAGAFSHMGKTSLESALDSLLFFQYEPSIFKASNQRITWFKAKGFSQSRRNHQSPLFTQSNLSIGRISLDTLRSKDTEILGSTRRLTEAGLLQLQ